MSCICLLTFNPWNFAFGMRKVVSGFQGPISFPLSCSSSLDFTRQGMVPLAFGFPRFCFMMNKRLKMTDSSRTSSQLYSQRFKGAISIFPLVDVQCCPLPPPGGTTCGVGVELTIPPLCEDKFSWWMKTKQGISCCQRFTGPPELQPGNF